MQGYYPMDNSKDPLFLAKLQEAMARRGVSVDVVKSLGVNIPSSPLANLISQDPTINDIKRKVCILAPSNISVLIIGETGTGKELIAQALHGQRPGKMVAVNCAGIPDTLLETEFFGCIKGAYTGAMSDRIGYVAEAENGTLFLDEIAEMPALLQAKMLRLLENRVYRPVGSVVEKTCNIRIVSATNKENLDLPPTTFRLDLYYRLAGTVLRVPNLTQRGEADVRLIVNKFAKNVDAATKIMDAVSLIQLRGNVRQLLNIIEEFNVLC